MDHVPATATLQDLLDTALDYGLQPIFGKLVLLNAVLDYSLSLASKPLCVKFMQLSDQYSFISTQQDLRAPSA